MNHSTSSGWGLASLLPNHVFLVDSTPPTSEKQEKPAAPAEPSFITSVFYPQASTTYRSPYAAVDASANNQTTSVTSSITSSNNPSGSSSQPSPPSTTDNVTPPSSSLSPSPSPARTNVQRKRTSDETIVKGVGKSRRTSESLTNETFTQPYYSLYGGDGASDAKPVTPSTYESQYKQQVHNTSAIQCDASLSTSVHPSTNITQSQGRAQLGSANNATYPLTYSTSTHLAQSQGRAHLGSANDATYQHNSSTSAYGAQNTQQPVRHCSVAQNGSTSSNSVPSSTHIAQSQGRVHLGIANDATFHPAAPTSTTGVQSHQQQHAYYPRVQHRNIQPAPVAARVVAPVDHGNFQQTHNQYVPPPPPPPPPEFSAKWGQQELVELLQPNYQFCFAFEPQMPNRYSPFVLACFACNDGSCPQCAVHYYEREQKIPHLLSSLAKYKEWQCRSLEKPGDQHLMQTVDVRVDWLNKRLEYAEKVVADVITWHTTKAATSVLVNTPAPVTQPQNDLPPTTVAPAQGPSVRCPNTGRFGPGNTPANKGVTKSTTKPLDNKRVTKKPTNGMPVNGKLWPKDEKKPVVRKRGRPSKGPADVLNARKKAAVGAALSAAVMPGYTEY